MRLKFLLLVMSLIALFFGCINKNQENNINEVVQNPIESIELENIGYIIVKKDNKKYKIKDKEELKSILLILKKSKLEYIKFGSKNKFIIYRPNGEIILTASYRGNNYKINGIVYRVNQNLFE